MTGIINFSLSSKISPVSFAQFEPSAPGSNRHLQTTGFLFYLFPSACHVSTHSGCKSKYTNQHPQTKSKQLQTTNQTSERVEWPLCITVGGSECPHGPSNTGEVQFLSYPLTTLINIVFENFCVSIKQFNQMCNVCQINISNQSQPSDCSCIFKKFNKTNKQFKQIYHVFHNLCCRLMASWPPFSACPV